MSGWDHVVLPAGDDGRPLSERCDALLEELRGTWPLLARGLEALEQMQTRRLHHGDAQVLVQANPGRRASVHAKTDAAAIAARPCFLCPENLPAEERGIAHGDMVVLPNPFPVVRGHLTIPSRQHTAQRLSGRIEQMLELAASFGSERFVLYNGPRCGASAPDHFHFQAGLAAGIPLFEQVAARGARLESVATFGRAGLVVRAKDAADASACVQEIVTSLPTAEGDDEPMLNVVAQYREGHHNVFVFPRARHRPDCFSEPEPHRVAISPASLEMMGLVVVADIEHFDRVTARLIEEIYRQVSMDAEMVRRMVRELA